MYANTYFHMNSLKQNYLEKNCICEFQVLYSNQQFLRISIVQYANEHRKLASLQINGNPISRCQILGK